MRTATLRSLVLTALLQDVATKAAITSESVSNSIRDNSTVTATTFAAYLTELPTDSRATYPSEDRTSTYSSLVTAINATASFSSTGQIASSTTSSVSETQLHGTASASGSVIGSVKCNSYEEFCDRKYSNVTYVVAHNSPFHIANNAASNQDFDVTTQLDNGVRGST